MGYRASKGHFNAVWEALSDRGLCDTYGGAEYARVYGGWIMAGMPTPIEGYIRRRANAPAPGPVLRIDLWQPHSDSGPQEDDQ